MLLTNEISLLRHEFGDFQLFADRLLFPGLKISSFVYRTPLCHPFSLTLTAHLEIKFKLIAMFLKYFVTGIDTVETHYSDSCGAQKITLLYLSTF